MTNDFWDFLEKYLPDYHARADVLRQGNLQLYIDGEDSPLADEISKDEAEDELHHILYNLYSEAVDAYTKGLGVECEHCQSEQGTYCSHCGKKLK